MSDRFARAIVVALLTPVVLLSSVSLAQPLVVWMDPNGNDGHNGLDEGNAVKTLGRVHTILEAWLSDDPQDAEVRIKAGTYVNDSVVWTFFMADHEIKFMCWPDVSPRVRPLFKSVDPNYPSRGLGGTWFRLARDFGQPTNLTFRFLQVEHYDVAINFDGSRGCPNWNGYNTVFGCYFYEIGNTYTDPNEAYDPNDPNDPNDFNHLAVATACLCLQNSRNNLIQNNHFISVESTPEYNHIHAIYLADYSSNNMIKANKFKHCMGDPVKIRNGSNWNRITENRFIGCGIKAAVTDWFCLCPNTPDCDNRCQCRSWENRVYSNLLDGNYHCTANLPAWCVHVHDPNGVGDCRDANDPLFDADSDGCPPEDPNCVSSAGCSSANPPHRFHTWSNTTTSVPCSSE